MRPHHVLLVSILITTTIAPPIQGDDTETTKVIEYIHSRSSDYVHELAELVSIPSISAIPEHQTDILRASEWVAKRFRTAGLRNVKILNNPVGPRPAVYAEFIVDNTTLPTALIYGHYDVQPADPIDAWMVTPPFTPLVVNDSELYGRGASDDKGCFLPTIQAVEAYLSVHKTLPINIKFIIEGEEEIGSPHLEPFLEAYAHVLAADFVLSADGNQFNETQSSLSLGLRGAVAVELTVQSLSRDVHSGSYGGAVQNPARALVQLLDSMFDAKTNRVAVEGFYDNVRAISAEDKNDVANAAYDEKKELIDGIGALEPFGEDGYGTVERIWFRPTLEIVGISSGYAGPGIKTVLPAVAIAKLASRLVPDQTPQSIVALIKRHVEKHPPQAVTVTVTELGFKAYPFVTGRDSVVNAAAAAVLKEVVGTDPLFIRGGATIPAMAAFSKHLHAETTTLSFALPSDTVHAPDERMSLRQYHKGREAYVLMIAELGKRVQGGELGPGRKKKEKETMAAVDFEDHTEL